MPVYAEVVVRLETEERAVDVDSRLDEAILPALRDDAPENIGEPQPRQRLADVIGQEIARQFGPDAYKMLRAGDHGDPVEFIASVIRRVRHALGGASLPSLDLATLERAVRDAIRQEAGSRGMRLEPPAKPTPTLWAYPLGVLATDHTGYLSYDLSSLPATVLQAVATAVRARRLDPVAALDVTISLYPIGLGGVAFDALSQGRFTLGAIVARLELAKPLIPYAVLNLALPAMQSPSLGDWRLSPGSFATNPGSLVGADGCESILPANVSLQEFYLYQVVRLTDVAPPVASVTPGQVQLGVVNEYRVAWHSLGHSLGQILYSLPLAPGESVNLAVIDWTRRDEAQRKERTTVDEQLIHNEHRDRVISETVDAAVREYQHGSSFMGGGAGAVGISYGPVSAGIAGSLGGSTSNSSGNRSVVASTVQKVSDNITQVSSVSRELQSTVVVQSTQLEKETIETRTVANYNHSHALTILYYEVLRHFRVSTEWVRRRPAVLVKMKTDWFEGAAAAQNVLEHRAALEATLLDARFAEGFKAIERLSNRGTPFSDFTTPLPPPPANPAPAAQVPAFRFFEFEMTTGGFHRDVDAHDQSIDIRSTLLGKAGAAVDLCNIDGGNVLNNFGAFSEPFKTNTFVAIPVGGGEVRWDAITAIALVVAVHPDDGDTARASFSRIKLTALDDFTGRPGVVLLDQSYENGHLIVTNNNDENGRRRVLPTLPFPRPPAPPSGYAASDVADHAKSLELIAHLTRHKGFYSRAILLNRNPVERAAEFDAIKLMDGSNVLEKIENRPIDVIGEYMAFPGTDSTWEDKVAASLDELEPDGMVLDERLVALPTRGVFAEAKLGHCNASELIDNTRFWDWQQSPIPHMAPEIAPITAVTPQPQQQNLGATPLPTSIVNIVNPPNAPDPTGMSAALSLLATPNIFRDMSGRTETADILKNLADNAVKIAAVAGAARTGQSGSGGGLSGGSRSTGTGGGGLGGPRAMPNQPSVINRDLQDLGNVLGRAQADNLITPEAARDVYEKALLGFAASDAGAGDAGGTSGPPLIHTPQISAAIANFKSTFSANPKILTAGQFQITQLVREEMVKAVNADLTAKPDAELQATWIDMLDGAHGMDITSKDMINTVNGRGIAVDYPNIVKVYGPDPTATKAWAQGLYAQFWSGNTVNASPSVIPATLARERAAFDLGGIDLNGQPTGEKGACHNSTHALGRKYIKAKGLAPIPVNLKISQGQIAGATIATGPGARDGIVYSSAQALKKVVDAIKLALDAGYPVICGLLSGVRHDMKTFPTPEHYVLVFAHENNVFAFWDSDASVSNMTAMGWGPGFGILVATADSFATGFDGADLDAVGEDGNHLYYPKRHCYQVYYVQTLPV